MNGVIYLNNGTKCIVRLLVSIHSLRKHYDGPVVLFQEGRCEAVVEDFCKQNNVVIVDLPKDNNSSYVKKVRVANLSEFDHSLFLDADTVVNAPIEPFFEYIEKYGMVFTKFADWVTTGQTMSKRIRKYTDTYPDLIRPALLYGDAINTGIFGVTKNHPMLEYWMEVTLVGAETGVPITDEIAAQVVAPKYEHYLTSHNWNYSVKYGESVTPLEEAKIIHYHGRKHLMGNAPSKLWEKEFDELLTQISLPHDYGDVKVRKHMKGRQHVYRDTEITFVTAVNNMYLDKLRSNYEGWKTSLRIEEHNLIIYYDETVTPDPNIKGQWIKWEYEADSPREKMLACFVFGAPKDVQTDYWIKLDADVTTTSEFFPFWAPWKEKHDLVGHKWSYTKVKGDTKEGHWLNRLDDWWEAKTGEPPIFPKIEGRTYRHPRLASFFCFHKTEMTKKFVEQLDGEFLVPSHDTLFWYLAERMGYDISWCNMKRKGLSP